MNETTQEKMLAIKAITGKNVSIECYGENFWYAIYGSFNKYSEPDKYSGKTPDEALNELIQVLASAAQKKLEDAETSLRAACNIRIAAQEAADKWLPLVTPSNIEAA